MLSGVFEYSSVAQNRLFGKRKNNRETREVLVVSIISFFLVSPFLFHIYCDITLRCLVCVCVRALDEVCECDERVQNG